MDSSSIKKYVAEMIGTAVLTLVGCGTAVATGDYVATALAFGLSVVAMAYCIGNISGCHLNPAITIGMLIEKRIEGKDAAFYIVAQFIGGIVGALLLYLFLGQIDGYTIHNLGANNYGGANAITCFGAILVEVVLTFIFVFAALGVTSKTENAGIAGVIIGLTLTLVHLIGIAFTGTSVNPARSFGPALFTQIADSSLNALPHVWVFILAPVIGAVLAGFAWKALKPSE